MIETSIFNNEIVDISSINMNIHSIINKIKSSIYNQDIHFIYLGKKDYNLIWKVQKKIHSCVKQKKLPNLVLFLEHNHVYTFGKNSNKDYLLDSYPKSTQIIESDRGGQITYHGPGQLIGYPIIDLNDYQKSITWYMKSLEEVIILTLKDFNIDSERKKGMTGVWVEDEKICAIGVRLSHWVTMHGFALNINPDMNYFNYMIPCGIFDYGVTSINQILSNDVTNMEIIKVLSNNFIEVFERSN